MRPPTFKLAARSITFGSVGTTRPALHEHAAGHRAPQRGKGTRRPRSSARSSRSRSATRARQTPSCGPLVDRAAVGHFEAAVRDAVRAGRRDRLRRQAHRAGQATTSRRRSSPTSNRIGPASSTRPSRRSSGSCRNDTLEQAIRIHNERAAGPRVRIHSSNLANIELFLPAAGTDCGIAKVNMGTTGADIGAAFGGERKPAAGALPARTRGKAMRRQSVCVNWGGESPWDQRIQLLAAHVPHLRST